jgi:phosphotransferase system enzyme I (PtsI)
MNEIILKGIAAASGIARGAAFILDKQDFVVPPRAIMDNEAPIEIARFDEALMKTRQEILELKKKMELEGGQHAQIFDAHLLVLEDRSLIEEVLKRIKSEKLSAEYIFSEVLKKYIKMFSKIEDEYLRERVTDINDVGRRVLKNLMDETKLHELDSLTEEMIIVSHDLSPSDTASMYRKNIIGFVTDVGGKTSHSAIMAKSLGVPAVVGLKDATLKIHNQDFLIVDGREGIVIVNPSAETIEKYTDAQNRMIQLKDRFQDVKDLPAQTTDAHRVTICANVELPEELPGIIKSGANGIGLYRTEFFYMNRTDLPTEEEQFAAYKKVAETIAPNPVTIRTLDIGGDKFISSLDIPKDMYSFLGWRAIRFCLARPDIFKTQLRAILRASMFGKIRLMYPMIAGVCELRRANTILDEVKAELRQQKISFDKDMKVGIMIEVPSAAMIVDLLAKEVDFFSIGTNDLVQYTLAIDRVNEQTADLYEPGHPAILRMIKNTIDAAHKEGIEVGLCGEISGEPMYALLLLGLGLDDFSMSPSSLPQIKKLIRSVSFKNAQELAREAFKLSTGREVEDLCRARLKQLAPDIIGLDKA